MTAVGSMPSIAALVTNDCYYEQLPFGTANVIEGMFALQDSKDISQFGDNST